MTRVASAGALDKLSRAMGSGRRLDPIERHVWVRERLCRHAENSDADARQPLRPRSSHRSRAFRHLAAGIPGARYVSLPGANHLMLEEEPAWSLLLEELG